MNNSHDPNSRRNFLKLSAGAGLVTALGSEAAHGSDTAAPTGTATTASARRYNTEYRGSSLNHVAFPLGGIGAGMFCLEGTGALSHFSIRNRPDIFNEPCMFAALVVRGPESVARVLEGPVPGWKVFGLKDSGMGEGEHTYGLPRFEHAEFSSRFPFATVKLQDRLMPVKVDILGWSPFTPGDADSSSLPVAALEYRFMNATDQAIEAVFSFNASNFLGNPKSWRDPRPTQEVRAIDGGFALWSAGAAENPWDEAGFAAAVDDPGVQVNHAWFRGGGFDALTMAWNDIAGGASFDRPPVGAQDPSPGATLFVPLVLGPRASRTIVLRLSWFSPRTNLQMGAQGEKDSEKVKADVPSYQPWYASQFRDIAAVGAHWKDRYSELRRRSAQFADAFYDSTVPPEIIEAVAANLGILKSPTVLRQLDGRLWAWEGCGDDTGCCQGSCTHVWNYTQALPHLFPQLERSLRETEFGPDQDERGHQEFRAALPIRPISKSFHPAADGQLGGIMKVHREWRISGDTQWLRELWPKVRKSLDYCIETWDPQHKGWVEEPHHNTYDIEFWGPEGMCTSIYLGALRAAVIMGQALGDNVSHYQELLDLGRKRVEQELFNGEYFFQKIEWQGLRAGDPTEFKSYAGKYSAEARALLEKEGPRYQYGTGCLSDGVLGAWLAQVCGVGDVLDRGKVASHLRSVHRYNLKKDLSKHVNPQRPGYAMGEEGGLLLCSWPKGGALSLPFIYSNEVWTGIEYQVASHLMLMGRIAEGLEIVRTCRDRYDGRVRNPFDEYECGHWYARALSSYALLQGVSGARYDAVDEALHLQPAIKGDFRSFIATATGYGTVGVKAGQPFLEVVSGKIPVKKIHYAAAT
jgi:uncharacterized protein (DUF608 family)